MNLPVLTIAGELDHKFAAIGRQVASSVPHGEAVEIAGVGHAAHLQQPELVAGALNAWLQKIKY